MAAAGVDAYFGVRPENSRYLTGLVLGDGEEKVAGYSGWFVVTADELIVFADSRYTIQVSREAPDARIEPVYGDLRQRWPEIAAGLGVRRVAVEAGHLSHAAWTDLAGSAPEIELVPANDLGEGSEPGPGWVEADRATKEPAELERVAAACAVADRALATLLPEIRPGVTEAQLAWRLEVLIEPAARTAWPSTSPAWPGRRPPCPTARRATDRFVPARSSCSISGPRSPAIGAT